MHKDNGRLAPAPKEEVAKLKGKTMVCSKCGKEYTIQNASFDGNVCQKCKGSLTDKDFDAAGKITGK